MKWRGHRNGPGNCATRLLPDIMTAFLEERLLLFMLPQARGPLKRLAHRAAPHPSMKCAIQVQALTGSQLYWQGWHTVARLIAARKILLDWHLGARRSTCTRATGDLCSAHASCRSCGGLSEGSLENLVPIIEEHPLSSGDPPISTPTHPPATPCCHLIATVAGCTKAVAGRACL